MSAADQLIPVPPEGQDPCWDHQRGRRERSFPQPITASGASDTVAFPGPEVTGARVPDSQLPRSAYSSANVRKR